MGPISAIAGINGNETPVEKSNSYVSKDAADFEAIFEQASKEYGISKDVLKQATEDNLKKNIMQQAKEFDKYLDRYSSTDAAIRAFRTSQNEATVSESVSDKKNAAGPEEVAAATDGAAAADAISEATEQVENTDAAAQADAGSADASANAGSNLSSQYDDLFAEAADTYGVPAELLKAVAQHASGFDGSNVKGDGSAGLMGLAPATQRSLGVTDPLNPEENIMAGAKLMNELLTRFDNNTEQALAAWAYGADTVERAGGVPEAAYNYVASVRANMPTTPINLAAPSPADGTSVEASALITPEGMTTAEVAAAEAGVATTEAVAAAAENAEAQGAASTDTSSTDASTEAAQATATTDAAATASDSTAAQTASSETAQTTGTEQASNSTNTTATATATATASQGGVTETATATATAATPETAQASTSASTAASQQTQQLSTEQATLAPGNSTSEAAAAAEAAAAQATTASQSTASTEAAAAQNQAATTEAQASTEATQAANTASSTEAATAAATTPAEDEAAEAAVEEVLESVALSDTKTVNSDGTVTMNLEDIFKDAANKYGVDVNILKAIGYHESRFQVGAKNASGATGVMQLMPGTARAMGVADSTDARQNIEGGAKLISTLLDRYDGNLRLAIAAYSAGEGNVAKYGGVPPFSETQNYVSWMMNNRGTTFDANQTVTVKATADEINASDMTITPATATAESAQASTETQEAAAANNTAQETSTAASSEAATESSASAASAAETATTAASSAAGSTETKTQDTTAATASTGAASAETPAATTAEQAAASSASQATENAAAAATKTQETGTAGSSGDAAASAAEAATAGTTLDFSDKDIQEATDALQTLSRLGFLNNLSIGTSLNDLFGTTTGTSTTSSITGVGSTTKAAGSKSNQADAAQLLRIRMMMNNMLNS